MASVPASGRVSMLSNLKPVFGGATPVRLSDYYTNAASQYTASVSGVPSTGARLAVSAFRGKTKLAGVTGLTYTSSLGTVPTTSPASITSNGSTYTVLASEAPQFGSVGGCFGTASFYRTFQVYSSSGGANAYNAYTGSNTITDAASNVRRGVWVGIDMPAPVTLTQYGFKGNNGYDQPAKFTLLASTSSNNGTWVAVDTRAQTTLSSLSSNNVFTIASPSNYQHYRMVVEAISGSTIQSTLYLQQLRFYSR